MNNTHTDFPIHGTVYGVLLNANAEWQNATAQMTEAPYQAAPKAPVLYVKTANTWSANNTHISLPRDVPAVEVGATLGVVFGAPNSHGEAMHVRGYVLLNDVSIPHTISAQGFYRPPVKYKCLDGFLGIGPALLPASDLPDPNTLLLEVRINGQLRQTIDLGQMRRKLPALVNDVSEFMTLHAGNVLMLGLDICTDGAEAGHRPLAHAGDVIEIHAPNVPGLGVLRHTLIETAAVATAQEMAA